MDTFHEPNAVENWKKGIGYRGVSCRRMGDMYGVFVRGQLRSIRQGFADAERDAEDWRESIKDR